MIAIATDQPEQRRNLTVTRAARATIDVGGDVRGALAAALAALPSEAARPLPHPGALDAGRTQWLRALTALVDRAPHRKDSP